VEPESLGRQERLTNAVALLAAACDEAGVLAILRDHARAIAGSDGITIVRRDGDAVEYIAEGAISPLWLGQRFPLHMCISGLAILAGAPVLIPDIRNDPRVPLNAYLATFVLSMAMFPIGRTHAMGAYWQHSGPVDPGAVDRMSSLAAAAVRVLDRTAPPIRAAG